METPVCFSEVAEVTYEGRLRALEGRCASSKTLQGPEGVTSEMLVGIKVNNILTHKGSLICLLGRSMIFHITDRNELR